MKTAALFLSLAVPAAAASLTVIPAPVRVTAHPGELVLDRSTVVVVSASDTAVAAVGEGLAASLRRSTGFPFEVVKEGAKVPRHAIRLRLDPKVATPEGYRLSVRPAGVEISAGSAAGLFYGTQTLLQLAPPAVVSASPVAGLRLALPAVDLDDAPRFPYRGMHLDVSRHFFSVEYVKRYIDLLAMYKLNTFHWHLTDDQGWRVEIKKYPKLTEVGAWRNKTQMGIASDGQPVFEEKRYGGFYTQDEIRDVVRYAQARFVTIIPEIETPGHASAALAAYPELGCAPRALEVPGSWGVFEDIFCPTEKTFAFLEDVLTEIVDLFPGPLIHVGGDEVPKVRWQQSALAQELIRREGLKDEEELQAYFMRRLGAFLASKGRRLIGWDEIVAGGLPSEAVIMSWRGMEGGVTAARAGHDVVMAPEPYTYFDYYQAENVPDEPRAQGGYTPLEKVYAFEPVPPGLSEAEARHILGPQACLWSEHLHEPEQAFYMLLPRLLALSEVAWSPREARDWDAFTPRVAAHLKRLDQVPVRYAHHFFRVRHQHEIDASGRFRVRLLGNSDDPIHYTLDGTTPDARSPRYEKPMELTGAATVVAIPFRDGKALAAASARTYSVNLATGRPVRYGVPFSERYPSTREHALTSGVRGGTSYSDRWQGFDGTDVDATIDLGMPKSVRRMRAGFMRYHPSWVMLPRSVLFQVSNDGKSFETVATVPVDEDDRDPSVFLKDVAAEWAARPARFVRVHATNYGPLPPWHPGAGTRPWIFVDQIIVE